MIKYNKEEGARFGIIKNGRTTRVRANLEELETGEVLIIERGKDWIGKSPPYYIIRYFANQTKRKFKYGRTVDGIGWIVKRIE